MNYQEFARVKRIVQAVSFPKYEFHLEELGPGFAVYVRYREPDVMTGVGETQEGRKWYFPTNQTKSQIVQTCFKALLTSLEHRAREFFLLDGKPVLQPHQDLDTIWKMLPERDKTIDPNLLSSARNYLLAGEK